MTNCFNSDGGFNPYLFGELYSELLEASFPEDRIQNPRESIGQYIQSKMKESEAQIIKRVLEQTNSNKTKAAKVLNDLKIQIERTRKALDAQETDFKKTAVRRAVTMTSMLRKGLKEWFDFYNGYDPLFTWWAAESYKDTDRALQSYEGFLRKKLGEAQSKIEKISINDDGAVTAEPLEDKE